MNYLPYYKKCSWGIFFIFILAFALQDGTELATGQSTTANPVYTQIDDHLTSRLSALHIPGISLSIVKGNQIVHMAGFGVADPSGRPMTPQTPMLIGSVTKSITALAIMQLVEAGKINLDAPVEVYLSWFRVLPPSVGSNSVENQVRDAQASEQTPSLASTSITIRHLLNHTSGLSRSAGERMMLDGDSSALALERSVRALGSEQLNRQPGSAFEYSNANYVTLGMVVQAVTGQSYEAYIQEHIFKSLDMDNSFTSQVEAQQHGFSAGYRQWFGFPLPAADLPYPRGMLPAGYLFSSAEDLGHYLIAQLNQGHYKGSAILSPEGIQTLQAPAVTAAPEGYHKQPFSSYGMGWYSLEMNGIPVVTHDGDTPTFHADIILIPSGQWGIALLVNSNSVLLGEDIRSLAAGVVNLLNGQPPKPSRMNYPVLFLYVFMSGFLIFEVSNLVRLVASWRRPIPTAWQMHSARFKFRHLGLPLLIGWVAVVWMLVGMPWMFQASWPVMLLNQPDLSWVILVGGALALVNGLLRCGRNAWKIVKG